jgi:hypothetical protein
MDQPCGQKGMVLPALNVDKDRAQSSEKKRARKTKLEKIRQDKHATIIQARWRGAKTRDGMKLTTKQSETDNLDEPDTQLSGSEVPAATLARGSHDIAKREEQKEENVGGTLPPDKPEWAVDWPEAAHDTFQYVDSSESEPWPSLDTDDDSVLRWVLEKKKVLVRAVTWNMEAKKPPTIEEAQKLLIPLNKYV